MSGGWFAVQVSVWPCCSRTARLVTARLPSRRCSSAVTAAMVALSGRRRGAGVGAFMVGVLGPLPTRPHRAGTPAGAPGRSPQGKVEDQLHVEGDDDRRDDGGDNRQPA